MPFPGLTQRMPALGVPPSSPPVAKPIQFSAFDPQNIGSGINLRFGNLFAFNSTGTIATAIGAKSGGFGMLYAEFVVAARANSNFSIGLSIITNSASTSLLGSYVKTVGILGSGSISSEGTSTQTASSFSTGDVISIAYNVASARVFFAVNGIYPSGDNPSTNTGGSPAPSGLLYLAGAFSGGTGGAPQGVLLETGSFLFGPPPGYQAWG